MTTHASEAGGPQLATAAEATGRLAARRTIVAGGIFVAVLLVFLTQTRLPAVLGKLPTLDSPASGSGRSAFSQFLDPASLPEPLRWIAYGVNLWDANAVGMFFAILLGGAAIAAIGPEARMRALMRRRGRVGAAVGGGMGLPLFMCSACSAPVSMGFYRGGAALEPTLAMMLGSALFNPVGILAIVLLMPGEMAAGRIAFGLAMIFLVVPLVARLERRPEAVMAVAGGDEPSLPPGGGAAVALPRTESWGRAAREALRAWGENSIDLAVRLVPAMLAAGFVVGAILTFAPPQQLSDMVGSELLAVAAAAAVGTLIQIPTLFEIPLVLGVLALGLGVGPAAALLVTAPSFGVVTLGLTRKDLGWRTPASMLGATWVGGVAVGLVVSAL